MLLSAMFRIAQLHILLLLLAKTRFLVSLSDGDGLQVHNDDEQPSKHNARPGSAAGSAFVSESHTAPLATAQDDSDDVYITGTSVQPPNASSLGEGGAGGGAGRKRGRENESAPTMEEGDEFSLNF